MKIALVTNIFPPHAIGGYELGCRDIAEELVAGGHDVHVVTSLPVGKLLKTRPATHLRVHQLFEPIFGFEADLGARLADSSTWGHERTEAFGGVVYGNALSLARWLSTEQPDVVWLFNTVGLGPVGIFEAALSARARVLTLLMDDIDSYVTGSRRNLSWQPRFRRLKSRIDAISCSRKTQAQNEHVGCYRSHRVIYNGIRFATTEPTAKTPEFSFCYFGQVEEPKGLLQLVRGAAALAAARPSAPFSVHVYGGGSRTFRERLETEARERGLGSRVVLHGFCDKGDLLARVRRHHVAVLLLKDEEPFGYAPLEAASAGLPVILTRRPGAAECLRGEYPLFVDRRDDSAEVASRMAWCMEHPLQLAEAAAGARADFRAHCDLDAVTLPAYGAALAGCPVNPVPVSIEALLANARTADFYARARLPHEQLRAAGAWAARGLA